MTMESIVSIKPFKDDVTQISLINAANEKNTLTIGGILEQSDLKEYGFLGNDTISGQNCRT